LFIALRENMPIEEWQAQVSVCWKEMRAVVERSICIAIQIHLPYVSIPDNLQMPSLYDMKIHGYRALFF
jgi:hypothetical protein